MHDKAKPLPEFNVDEVAAELVGNGLDAQEPENSAPELLDDLSNNYNHTDSLDVYTALVDSVARRAVHIRVEESESRVSRTIAPMLDDLVAEIATFTEKHFFPELKRHLASVAYATDKESGSSSKADVYLAIHRQLERPIDAPDLEAE